MPSRAVNTSTMCVCVPFARHLEAKSLGADDFQSNPWEPLENTIRERKIFTPQTAFYLPIPSACLLSPRVVPPSISTMFISAC